MTIATARSRALLSLALAGSIGLAACSGAAGPAGDPSAGPSAAADQPAASPPAAGAPGGGVDPGGGAGGGTGGNPGSGTGVGNGPAGPIPFDPAAGQAKLVRPVPGRLDPHPVAPVALQVSIDGRHVLVKVSWYGGLEPCSVLDSVRVERSGGDIAVTPIEGSSDRTAACAEIALLKATIVDLGELEPGTYRVTAPTGDAPPVTFTID